MRRATILMPCCTMKHPHGAALPRRRRIACALIPGSSVKSAIDGTDLRSHQASSSHAFKEMPRRHGQPTLFSRARASSNNADVSNLRDAGHVTLSWHEREPAGRMEEALRVAARCAVFIPVLLSSAQNSAAIRR